MRLLLISISVLCSAVGASINAQGHSFEKKVETIIGMVDKYHYSPRAIDDEFSSDVFTGFVELIDRNGWYLTSSDVERLRKYEPSIDDLIKAKDFSFIDEFFSVYQGNLKRVDELLNKFNKSDGCLNGNCTFKIGEREHSFEELEYKWNCLIWYYTLSSYYSQPDSVKQAVDEDALMALLLQKALDRESCKLQARVEGADGVRNFIEERFLKALAEAFDPHTSYFSNNEGEQFEQMLSKEGFSFGLIVSLNDFGELEIEELVPGAPAWNSNELNEGDVLLSARSSTGAVFDFGCVREAEAATYLSDEKVNNIVIKVRKVSGEEKEVPLSKAKVEVEDNVIKSFVLDGKRKVGYIYLPSFYTNEDEHGNYMPGCSNDLAKELIKIKREGIEGLILDIRGNGGGAMIEALQLAGIFVNYGALSIRHVRDKDPQALNDLNRGIIFNQPLVLIQGPTSASASELLSATLQDYNRAVIVGSNSYGKSTIQQVLPLLSFDEEGQPFVSEDNDGYLKLTIGKFYRITGESHQKSGVIPDIKLPSIYDGLGLGEAYYETALEATTIEKKVYAYPQSPLPIAELQSKSQQRVANDSVFKAIAEEAKAFKVKGAFEFPLDKDAFMAFMKEKKAAREEESDSSDCKGTFTVNNPEYLKGHTSILDEKEEINFQVMNMISDDPYIEEAYHIINDLIEIK